MKILVIVALFLFAVAECNDVIDFCKYQEEAGYGRANLLRWRYKIATKGCITFKYGGHGGNKNNFKTYDDCMKVCHSKIASYDDIESQPRKGSKIIPARCLEGAKLVGPCEALISRYSYIEKTGNCEMFYYGGCEGNNNNFETFNDCKQTCKPK